MRCWRFPLRFLAIALLTIGAACAPATQRPLSGAAPDAARVTATSPVPPTLESSDLRLRPLPSPSPVVLIVASPSPGAEPPIVRTISPQANGQVPDGGPVTTSAVLVGRGADLALATFSIDGAEAPSQVDRANPRQWTIQTTNALAPGPHSARVLVRDANGASGGFTWQFIVGDAAPSVEDVEAPAAAGPTARPAPAAPTPSPKPGA